MSRFNDTETVWIKENTITNGDCLELIRRVKSNSVKSIVTDPPFHQGMTHNGSKGTFVDLAISKPFFLELFKEFKRVLKEDGEVYFFTDWRRYAFYYPLMESVFAVRNVCPIEEAMPELVRTKFGETIPLEDATNCIVWDKISGAGNFYAFTYELIIYASQMGWVANKKGQNIWRTQAFSSGAKTTDGEKMHPTQKTIAIIEKCILDSTKEGDLVLDCFMGSGTTAIACRNLKRRCIGFELDIENFGIITKRMAQGRQSTLSLDLSDYA